MSCLLSYSIQILKRADNLEMMRKELMQAEKKKSPAKSPRLFKVAKFVEYLNSQLPDIPEHNWYNFTVDCIGLVEKYCVDDQPSQYSSGCSSYTSGVEGGSYSYSHSDTAYNRRHNYAVSAVSSRQYSSSMLGGGTFTTPRNEPVQAATGFQAGNANNSKNAIYTPISPPHSSTEDASINQKYLPGNTRMFSSFTQAITGKDLHKNKSVPATPTLSDTGTQDLPNFSDDLFE